MNIFNRFRDELKKIVEDMIKAGTLPAEAREAVISLEPPRDPKHGDLSTNAALVLAKSAGSEPRDLAAQIARRLAALKHVDSAVTAGPGFINLRVGDAFWQARIKDILKAGSRYGDSKLGAGQKVNVEYVSANPTGPMHVGHVRGAVFGDALANLLSKVGYKVTKEYYINDAGAQIDNLARSVYMRYCEALGRQIGKMPEDFYPGDYLVPVGRQLADELGDLHLDQPEEVWLELFRHRTSTAMMEIIKGDLAVLGIEHEVFFSERQLVASGRIEETLETLKNKGLLYEGVLDPPKGRMPEDWEARPQTLFRSTKFGDDVDRPLRKSDGSYTYFAADIAYHYDKLKRGFLIQIDVLGADHGGYVKRIGASLKALSDGKAELDVRLCQLVRLYQDGEPVKMSKRAGTFVTLRELVEKVGRDVVRFIMLTRKNDAPLDFDFAKVTEQSRENPVFYVQYAHARVCSVLKKAAAAFPKMKFRHRSLARADMSLLSSPVEISLIRKMTEWPRLVEAASQAHEPHRVAFYLYDLASEFHSLWNRGNEETDLRFVIAGNPELTRARMAMIVAVSLVIASGLEVLGVEPVEEMH
ncbi:MAG: arginine--tRNA ligase [Proteobacteria bacterium]|nr:arginine--tRNA ligase [Pseudomonadota bacterium]